MDWTGGAVRKRKEWKLTPSLGGVTDWKRLEEKQFGGESKNSGLAMLRVRCLFDTQVADTK